MSDTTALLDVPAPAPGEHRVRTWWRAELRPLLARLHFYAGLLIAPFLLVSALTGLAYTATPQIEELVHHDQLHVTAPPGAASVPLADQVTAASAATGLSAGAISEVRPPMDADGTTRVIFETPGLADGYFRTAFVDPYTAGVRGTLTTYGEWLPVRAWFDELHRTLHLGGVGRVYSELGASWLWVIVLSGLAMWFARRRRTRRLRRLVAPQRGLTGRNRLVSWHGSLGLWLAIGLLLLSATGLTWSQFAGQNVTAVRQLFSWSTPTVHSTLTGHGTGTAGPRTSSASGSVPEPADVRRSVSTAALAGDAQRTLEIARAHGMADPVELDPPAKPGQAWVVKQVQRSWPEKQDSMAVNPADGTVVGQLRFADWPLPAKLARWGVDAHMGLLFGLPNQILLAGLAIGLICMICMAYRMWWRRRPRLPVAGGGRPGFGTVAAVAVAAVAVGVFLPVFGASLLLFLAIDAVRTQRTGAVRATEGT